MSMVAKFDDIASTSSTQRFMLNLNLKNVLRHQQGKFAESTYPCEGSQRSRRNSVMISQVFKQVTKRDDMVNDHGGAARHDEGLPAKQFSQVAPAVEVRKPSKHEAQRFSCAVTIFCGSIRELDSWSKSSFANLSCFLKCVLSMFWISRRPWRERY